MSALLKLRQAMGEAVEELNSDPVIADPVKYGECEARIADLQGKIERTQAAALRAAELAQPVHVDPGEPGSRAENFDLAGRDGHGLLKAYNDNRSGLVGQWERYLSQARRNLGFTVDNSKHFRSLGEQLQAVYNAATDRTTQPDSRLVRAKAEEGRNRAPSGSTIVDPTGGGFLVQTDFMSTIFMLAHDMGDILQRVNKIPISANANGLKIPGVDETSRATGSRWGGVQSQWAGEGTAATLSKPKFRLIEFDLKKLISTMYVTDELIQDASALTAVASQAFSEEIMFMTEDAIWEGTGAGQPQGIMNAPALISVAKVAGQSTKTIVKENIDAIFARCWGRSRKNAVWVINQDVEPQLASLNQAVGTGGELVYMPPGGISAAPYATLKGRPILTMEYASTLGTAGDISLIDFSQYTMVDKGGVQAATSMHVAFLTDEQVFRITYRVDGRTMWSTAITPFKGSNTQSPFVNVATR